MTDPIITKTVSEAVAEKVRDLIMSGKLSWGQKLPSQRALAGKLNVAVSSIREGLQILQATGYVEIKRGQGTYVASDPGRALSKTLSMFLNADVRYLLEARAVLEVGVASLAATRAGKQDIEKMQACLDRMQSSLDSREQTGGETLFSDESDRISENDLEFHLTLAGSVNNPLLHEFVSAIRSSLGRFIGEIEHTRTGLEYHRKVLKAVREQDPDKAADAMKALLMITEQTYLKSKSTSPEH